MIDTGKIDKEIFLIMLEVRPCNEAEYEKGIRREKKKFTQCKIK